MHDDGAHAHLLGRLTRCCLLLLLLLLLAVVHVAGMSGVAV